MALAISRRKWRIPASVLNPPVRNCHAKVFQAGEPALPPYPPHDQAAGGNVHEHYRRSWATSVRESGFVHQDDGGQTTGGPGSAS